MMPGASRPRPGRPAAAQAVGRGPADSIVWLGVLAAVAVLFGVSGGLLWDLGYNYDGLSGSALTKIHPFTYMVSGLVAWRALSVGNPVAYAVHVANRRPAALFMMAVAFAMLLRTVLRQGPGMAGFIDSYVGPALLAILLADAQDRTMAQLDKLLHAVMTANAVMALFEFATRTPLFPYRFDGAVFATDLRSSALQGHPLANALLTAFYILALLTGEKTLPPALRLAMIGLQGAALVAFGGRTALVVAVVFGGLYLLASLFQSLRRGRISLLAAATGIVLLALVPVAVAGAGAAGFFDAVLFRFVQDGGSANARVEMLAIFDHLSLRDILVGPDLDLIETLRRASGLEWGIENPIVHMTLYQGAFLTLVVTVAVVLFLREVIRHCAAGTWLPILASIILLNTSESIAVKTTVLAKLVVILVCCYRPPVSLAAVPRAQPAWSGPGLRRSPDRELA